MKSRIQIAVYVFWALSLAATTTVALYFKNKFEVCEKKSVILLDASQEISKNLIVAIEATTHSMKANAEHLKAISIFWKIREREKYPIDPFEIAEIYSIQSIAKTEMDKASQCMSKLHAGPDKLFEMAEKMNTLSGK